MWPTCDYANHMKTIQIRNMPEDLHRKLKSRAALEGMTLSDYLLREFTRRLEVPTEEELLERISKLPPVLKPSQPQDAIDVVETIREMREERGEKLYRRVAKKDSS